MLLLILILPEAGSGVCFLVFLFAKAPIFISILLFSDMIPNLIRIISHHLFLMLSGDLKATVFHCSDLSSVLSLSSLPDLFRPSWACAAVDFPVLLFSARNLWGCFIEGIVYPPSPLSVFQFLTLNGMPDSSTKLFLDRLARFVAHSVQYSIQKSTQIEDTQKKTRSTLNKVFLVFKISKAAKPVC